MIKGIKSSKILLLTLVMLFSLVLGVVGLSTTNTTFATTETTFEMVETAQVRLDNPSGIRFVAKVSPDVKDLMQGAEEKGFLIFPKAYLDGVTGNYHDDLYDFVDIPVGNGTFYAEEVDGNKTGYYLVNGVLHTILPQNYALDFTSIAYYKTGSGYVYADFNADFGRDIYYVLSKTYLNDADFRADIDQEFSWLGNEDYPVQIENAEDMTAFSNAVKGGESFEGKTLALTDNITLENFSTVGSAFNGTFDYNGKTVTMVNGGDKVPVASEKVIDSTGKDVSQAIKGEEFALKVTESTAANLVKDQHVGAFVANADIPNKGDYTGDATKIANMSSGSIFKIKINYTKDQLTALKSKYNKATVSFMYAVPEVLSDKVINDNPVNDHGIVSKTGLRNNIALNTWHTFTISLDDLIATVGMTYTAGGNQYTVDNDQAFLNRVWTNYEAFDFYFGDIVLSYEAPKVFEALVSSNDVIVGSLAETKVDNATLKNTFSNLGDYAGGAVSVTYSAGADLKVKSLLSVDQLTALKSQYNQVKFGFGVEYTGALTSNANFESLVKKVGVTGVLINTSWYELTASIDDLIATITNNEIYFVKTWNQNGTYTFYYGDIELSYVEVPAPKIFEASEDTKMNIGGKNQGAFVTNADLKTIFGDLGDYKGGAITRWWPSADLTLEVGMTADEITALKDTYSQVKFTFGIALIDGTYVNNNETNSTNFLLSKAGYTGELAKNLPTGQWLTKTVSIDDFVSVTTGKSVLFFKSYTDKNFNIYLGDIEFVK